MGQRSLLTSRPARVFQGLSSRSWTNLALAACFALYLIQVALDLVWGNTCGHLGTDFCAFWSAGRAANVGGYAQAYDLGTLARIQLENFPAFGQISTFAVSPVAYLPVFLLPFQLLALLPAAAGFWIWTVLNAVGFVAYLRFFHRETVGAPLPTRLLVLLSLSLPVYWNFLDGQANVWLVICVGEFMRRALVGQSFRAGLWLGGLLLKPQALVLIALALLLQLSMRTIAGLATATAALLGSSLAMVGVSGAKATLQVWLGFARGMPTNDVDSMMNWRMLGFHLSNWFSPELGWGLAAAGMLVTVLATIYLWRRRLPWNSASFTFALSGTLAATGLVAWHSHIHMAMMLLPAMVVLMQRDRLLEDRVLEGWVLIPVAGYFLVYVLAALVKAAALPGTIAPSLNFLRGSSEFGVNAWILILAVQHARNDQHEASSV